MGKKKKVAGDVPAVPEKATSSAPIAPATITMVPLGRLMRADENVRHIESDAGVDELAADIEAHGLLSSLIGYETDTRSANAGDPFIGETYVAIVGGGRRLQALWKLAGMGQPGSGRWNEWRTLPVPVQIRDKSEAIELSLSENLARRDMNPVDEFKAFELLHHKASAAEIAKRFGFTERYVKQRLRLGDLDEKVLDAVRERQITLDAAMAYASTSDKGLQRRTFLSHQKQGDWGHKPSRIRQDISVKAIFEDHNLVRYIGIDAYVAAGGCFEDELFAEADAPRALNNVALVRQLAREKAEAELPAIAEANSVERVLLLPDLLARWNADLPKAPDDFGKVDVGYHIKECWNRARNGGASRIVGLAGIEDGKHYEDGKLQPPKVVFVERSFFVPKADVKKCEQPKSTSNYGETPEQRAKREAEAQAREIRRRATWLAIVAARKAGDQTPYVQAQPYRTDYETLFRKNGEIFARLPLDESTHAEFERLESMTVAVVVTPAQVDAMLADAEAQLAAEAQAKVDAEEAKRVAREADDAETKQLAQALFDNPPAVLVYQDATFFRHDATDGQYFDVRPDEDPTDAEHSAEDVGEFAEYPREVTQQWPTIEAYDAAMANAEAA